MRFARVAAAVLLTVAASSAGAADGGITKSHGIAIHGGPGYPADFTHFRYVDPNAPKGGSVRLSAFGTFDNLNPYILKGTAAPPGGVFESLMTSSADEANTEYGLIAESIETPADRSWAIFNLRPEARWHDGKPITADDVVFSFDIIKAKGHPQYRAYYKNVVKAEKLGPLRVKFSFSGGANQELPVIIGQLPVLPKHYWEGRDFTRATLEPPLGSGPYKVDQVDPGRSITFRRVENYWGAKLPVRVGTNNFDVMRYEYYRDRTVQREAFKAGEFDLFLENTAKDWALSYDFPALHAGLVKKEEIRHELPSGMQGFAFNIRRPLFQDVRVRQALGEVFDFEWMNKALFFGQYKRSSSYFTNSELASSGLPSPAELKILEPYRGRIPDQVFTQEYKVPVTDGSGNIRDNMRRAFALLKDAGWVVRDGKLVNEKTGQPFAFELLLDSPAFERVGLAFARNLKRLGIEMRIRTVDTAQYQRRIDNFDFDMTVEVFAQSLSPGNEQRDFWGSLAAGEPGSRNVVGIKSPVIDELVDLLIAAPDRQSLIDRTRALDRVLLWNFYVIPNWHSRVFRVIYWNKFGHPATTPKYDFGFNTWWIDPQKAAALAAGKQTLEAQEKKK